MRTYRGFLWGCILTAAAAGSPARASWDNVFQTCCWGCQRSQSAYYPPVAVAAPVVAAAPACGSCQPQCTTRYYQRAYYQPVTTYKQVSYYEPVTTYKTSYYYEPVQSYRYSSYYDPCSCGYQQVATPVTSYRLRTACSPVTSYLQRCALQPVQSYQLSYYYEPQTTCCQTTVGAPIVAQPAPAVAVPVPAPAVAVPAPAVSDPYAAPRQPAVSDGGGAIPPAVTDGSSRKVPSTAEPPAATMPPAGPSSLRQPQLGQPFAAPTQTPPPPRVRLDKIVSLPRTTTVEGEIVNDNRAPRSGAKVVFVSADQERVQEEVTADAGGRFHVGLHAGSWLVYSRAEDGRLLFHRKLDVRADDLSTLTLETR